MVAGCFPVWLRLRRSGVDDRVAYLKISALTEAGDELGPPVMNFLTIHGHGIGRGNPQPNLISLHGQNLDSNRPGDHNFFFNPSCENQHQSPP
jgi:hypothetical protein